MAQKAFEWTQKHPIHCVQVSDQESIQACIELADDVHVLVEPACGAAYAALTIEHPIIKKAQNIVVVICGGNAVNTDLLLEWKQAAH